MIFKNISFLLKDGSIMLYVTILLGDLGIHMITSVCVLMVIN